MDSELIKQKIQEMLPGAAVNADCKDLTLVIAGADWYKLAKHLRNDAGLSFDYLFCVTAVDWPDAFMMVYHLESTVHKHTVVIEAKIPDKENPSIDTVCDIWRAAELQEREAYDLMGIVFNNHPDLRRLFLTDDWVGFPLRKDYVDDINVIGL